MVIGDSEVMTYWLGDLDFKAGNERQSLCVFWQVKWSSLKIKGTQPWLPSAKGTDNTIKRHNLFVKGLTMGLISSEQQVPNRTDRGKWQRTSWEVWEQCLPSSEAAEGGDCQRPRVLGIFLIDRRMAFLPCEDRLIFCNGPWWTCSWRRTSSGN